jgi:rsbT co-antagonist protein RsbR
VANGQPHLSEAEIQGLRDVIELSRANRTSLLEKRRAMVEKLDPALLQPIEVEEEQSEEGIRALEEAVDSGDLTEYLANMKLQTAALAEQGLEFNVIGQALVELIAPVVDLIESTYKDDPPRVLRAFKAIRFLEMAFLLAAGSAYAGQREENLESEYQRVIRRLSTPVINVWDEVLVMPLVGVVDSTRAQQMMEQLLERIAAAEARFVLVDITGVPTVDTAVAEHLIKTTKAARLVGAHALLVGISPKVAQTLVRLGVSLSDVSTFPDLQSGLAHALSSLGYDVRRS